MSPSNEKRAESTLIGHYAGFSSRLIAFLIDTVIIAAVFLFVSWFIVTSWNMIHLEPVVRQLEEKNLILKTLVTFITSPLFYSLVSFLFVVTYYVFFWTIAGQTPGKGIMGLKILPRKGGKLKLGRAILRYLGYYLSIIPLGLGVLWILVDDRRSAWHDKIAGTCVVYSWEAKPDENFLSIETSKIIARTQAIRTYLDKKRNTG
jgi:uncharacterized RDD family membrane protein YckC